MDARHPSPLRVGHFGGRGKLNKNAPGKITKVGNDVVENTIESQDIWSLKEQTKEFQKMLPKEKPNYFIRFWNKYVLKKVDEQLVAPDKESKEILDAASKVLNKKEKEWQEKAAKRINNNLSTKKHLAANAAYYAVKHKEF